MGMALAQRVASILSFIVIARFVTEQDMGLLALTLAFIGVGMILAEFGLSASLVQRPDLTQASIDAVFTLTILLTAASVGLLALASGWIASFYGTPALQPLIWLAAAGLFLRGVFSPIRGLILRNQQFGVIAIIEFIGTVTGLTISIGLVIWTGSVTSLLYGQIADAAVTVVLGVLFARPLPKSVRFWSADTKQMVGFGATVSFSRTLDQISGSFDVLLIGKLFAPAVLGFFFMAQRLTMLLPDLFVSKLQQLMFPHFSRHQNDPAKLDHDFWTAVLTSGLAGTLYVSLAIVCGEAAILSVLGERWAPTVPYITPFAVAAAIQSLGGGVIGAYIFGTGRVYLTVWTSTFRIIALPVCIFAGSAFGPQGVAWAIPVYFIIGRLFSQLIVYWKCKLSIRPAAQILLQTQLPVLLTLLGIPLSDMLKELGPVYLLLLLVPTTIFLYCVGTGVSLMYFNDPRTLVVRNTLFDLLQKARR